MKIYKRLPGLSVLLHCTVGISHLPHVTYTDKSWGVHSYNVLLESIG